MSETNNHPTIKWAEVKETVCVTLEVPDCKDASITMDADKMTFNGTSHGAKYHCELDFVNEIDVEGSKYIVQDRAIVFSLKKKEEERWEKLLKTKNRHVKVDWDKWVDSDDEEEGKGMPGMDGMGDLSSLMGGGGMPGMGGGGMPGMGGPGGAGGMDMAAMMQQMQSMGMGGGMPGMGGDDGIDSDDDDLPDLEEDEDIPALESE